MELSNSQILLLVILVVALIFILGGCGLRCNGKNEGFYDQLRDNVSDPYFADACGGCTGCQRYNLCTRSGYAKSMPLDARGKPCPKQSYDILTDTTCPQCTTQVGRFY